MNPQLDENEKLNSQLPSKVQPDESSKIVKVEIANPLDVRVDSSHNTGWGQFIIPVLAFFVSCVSLYFSRSAVSCGCNFDILAIEVMLLYMSGNKAILIRNVSAMIASP